MSVLALFLTGEQSARHAWQTAQRVSCTVPCCGCHQPQASCNTNCADCTPCTYVLLLCRCADLDCDGVITPSEMWHFYEEQMKRLEGLNQEPVLFEDVLCQLHDMLQVRPAHSTPALARQLQQAVAAPVRGHACMAVSTCAVSTLRTPLSSRGSHPPIPS